MNDNLPVGTRVEHPSYGEGIISKDKLTAYEIFFERGGKVELTKRNDDITVIEVNENVNTNSSFDINDIEKMLEYVLDKHNALNEVVNLGEKWIDGTLILKPSDDNLKVKEIPIETFFHKIVMLRDRLRVLEQNINSHKKLNDEEKVNLQQYITRIYGSLTTFNILFADKENYFIGVKSK